MAHESGLELRSLAKASGQLEAGSSLDQAIVKASEELEVAYPALADQLRLLIAETRAGKARIEGKDYVMADGDVVEFRSGLASR